MMTRGLAVALLGSVVLACGATADEGTPPTPVRLDEGDAARVEHVDTFVVSTLRSTSCAHRRSRCPRC